MSYLLDTNTCIVFLNGRSELLKTWLLEASPESLLLCAVVKAELFYGALKSGRPVENNDDQILVIQALGCQLGLVLIT